MPGAPGASCPAWRVFCIGRLARKIILNRAVLSEIIHSNRAFCPKDYLYRAVLPELPSEIDFFGPILAPKPSEILKKLVLRDIEPRTLD